MSASKQIRIQTVAFGDRAQIGRALSATGANLRAEVLASAIVPMASNMLAGHSTFNGVFQTIPAWNKACPMQSALSTLKGKAKTAVIAAITAARESSKPVMSIEDGTSEEQIAAAIVLAQSAHDGAVKAINEAIVGALAVVKKVEKTEEEKKKAADEKAANALTDAFSVVKAGADNLTSEQWDELIALVTARQALATIPAVPKTKVRVKAGAKTVAV